MSGDFPHLTFFGDSSSRDKDFMVAGGFAVAGVRMAEIEDQIASIREDGGIKSEFHWSAYRGGPRKAAYERLVQYGFDLINKRKAALHVIVTPFKGYNHKARQGETRDTSINRMYWQLCLHRLAAFYGQRRLIHIRLDAGNDSSDICKMRNELCAAAFKHPKYKARPNCIRSIEPINSENSGIVQLADVIIGGIAAKQNQVAHKSAKGELADFILRSSGRHTWSVGTPMNARFLTVWHFEGRQVPRSPSS